MTWQAGDLAVCVDASSCGPLSLDAPKILREGRIYTVAAVTPPDGMWVSGFHGCGLILVGVTRLVPNPDFAARRFRKVVSDKREACEPEFVTLLKRIKHTVPASAMSAGTAETQSGSGLQPASAAREAGDAQNIGGPSQ